MRRKREYQEELGRGVGVIEERFREENRIIHPVYPPRPENGRI
jgi:hypothetical protein